jgi:hypothetical protein
LARITGTLLGRVVADPGFRSYSPARQSGSPRGEFSAGDNPEVSLGLSVNSKPRATLGRASA